jgi:hypothetical protein
MFSILAPFGMMCSCLQQKKMLAAARICCAAATIPACVSCGDTAKSSQSQKHNNRDILKGLGNAF